ncbi:MAG: hypothetical protein EA364_07010 [Balneolaceae bacterium]|jgi:hypothetical protein|nr:MAG: hypothetical protein EA364_07010 [Balneolaceae bacterium]
MTKFKFKLPLKVVAAIAFFWAGCNADSKHDKTTENAIEQPENSTENMIDQHKFGIPGELRRSDIDTSPILTQMQEAETGSSLSMDLFGDISIQARLIGKSRMVPGVFSYRYEIDEPESGILVISVNGDEMIAQIDLPASNRIFTILPVRETSRHIVVELDPSAMDVLEGGEPIFPADF